MDTKFTGAIKDLEIRLSNKFTAQFKEHGERLARIEAKLDIDPPRRGRIGRIAALPGNGPNRRSCEKMHV